MQGIVIDFIRSVAHGRPKTLLRVSLCVLWIGVTACVDTIFATTELYDEKPASTDSSTQTASQRSIVSGKQNIDKNTSASATLPQTKEDKRKLESRVQTIDSDEAKSSDIVQQASSTDEPEHIETKTLELISHNKIPPQEAPRLLNSDFNKLLTSSVVVLITLIFSGILIPIGRYLWTQYNIKSSYLSWVRSNVNSALLSFGELHAYNSERCIEANISSEAEWFNELKKNGDKIPDWLIQLHQAHTHCQKNIHKEKHTVPYVTFTLGESYEIEHEHPVWRLSKSKTEAITDYLLSQKQVKAATEHIYSDSFFKLASSDIPERKDQWVRSLESLIWDTVETFRQTVKLEKKLKVWSILDKIYHALLVVATLLFLTFLGAVLVTTFNLLVNGS